MILQSLRALALREGLVDDPAFESKPVRWVVRLKRNGELIGVYDTNQTPLAAEGKKGKPRPEAKMMVIPRRRGRTVNIAADFLVDKAEYALGLALPGTSADIKTTKRLADFVEMLDLARAATGSVMIPAVVAFLGDEAARSRCAERLAEQGGFATNDLFAFEVDGEDLQADEDLGRWWVERTRDPGHTAARPQQCLVCGRVGAVVEKHNMIQIRGGSTSGIPMVSFNSDAFEKYGFSRSENAPVCNECMTAYVEGLRRLTKPRYVLPRTGMMVGPLSTSLNDDTTAVYWADADSDLVSTLPSLRDDPKKVCDLLRSPSRGMRFSVGETSRFYCLILSGAQGRAMVRKIHTGTVAEVERNLVRYFAAIDVERFDRSAPMPQFLLLKSMALFGELDRLSPGLASEMWLAALFGHPLSRLFLANVVTRIRVEQQNLKKKIYKVSSARAALLHFYFASHGFRATSHGSEISAEGTPQENLPMGLDEHSIDRAYVLGRVMALAERMQMLAQPQGLNRTVVDRFYSMASTKPSLVFSTLLKGYGYHRNKAMRDVSWSAKKIDREFGETLLLLVPAELGRALTLEEQGRFGLGYYHQRQQFFPSKDSGEKTDMTPNITDSSIEENA